MSQTAPIFAYSDYRTYLNAHFQIVKRRNRRWSYGAWAKALKLGSTSSLTKVLRGQREAGSEIADRLAHYFEFNRQEAAYFEDLIQLSKLSDKPRLSVMLMEKMEREHPEGAIRILTDDEFTLISEWYPYAIRQLVKRKRFVESGNWISQQFRFPLSPTQALQALSLLQRLGLLTRDSRGRLRHAVRTVDTSNDIASEALKRHHEQALSQAVEAIRSIAPNQREITATTFAMRAKDLPRAKEFIRKMRADFVRTFECEGGDSVFRVQLQLVPLTKFPLETEVEHA